MLKKLPSFILNVENKLPYFISRSKIIDYHRLLSLFEMYHLNYHNLNVILFHNKETAVVYLKKKQAKNGRGMQKLFFIARERDVVEGVGCGGCVCVWGGGQAGGRAGGRAESITITSPSGRLLLFKIHGK